MSSRAEEPPRGARAELVETGEAIALGVERLAPGYLVRTSATVVAAWGRCPPETRARITAELATAAQAATTRVASELRALTRTSAADQRATPLEVVRTLPREPTAVLAGAGIAPVVRDPFDEAAAPDDVYGLAPRTLGDLGDPELAPLHLAWGMAKARALAR